MWRIFRGERSANRWQRGPNVGTPWLLCLWAYRRDEVEEESCIRLVGDRESIRRIRQLERVLNRHLRCRLRLRCGEALYFRLEDIYKTVRSANSGVKWCNSRLVRHYSVASHGLPHLVQTLCKLDTCPRKHMLHPD